MMALPLPRLSAGPGVVLNGTYPSAAGCSAACEANQAAGGLCTIWTWHDQNQVCGIDRKARSSLGG